MSSTVYGVRLDVGYAPGLSTITLTACTVPVTVGNPTVSTPGVTVTVYGVRLDVGHTVTAPQTITTTALSVAPTVHLPSINEEVIQLGELIVDNPNISLGAITVPFTIGNPIVSPGLPAAVTLTALSVPVTVHAPGIARGNSGPVLMGAIPIGLN